MAVIIPLKREADLPLETMTATTAPNMSPADVILFPGVRYERWSGDQFTPPAQSESAGSTSSSFRRDWLEI
jgi:hypothetical protein